MDDLAERIKAVIENPNGELWFPELTADLAAQAWDNLHRDLGLTLDTYGTERVLSRNLSAPREIITKVRTCPSTYRAATTIAIEELTPACAAQYHKQAVTFYTPDEILHSQVLSCIEEALALISQVSSLMRTIATLVRSLHVIKPADEDHDVSFSEPHVPFSIFVSVSEKRIANDALRVAEAIVHEAMHLQLTLFEKLILLAEPGGRKYYSPWKKEYRDCRGVLHALYVFAVIDRFLGQAITAGSEDNALRRIRRDEISKQISQVQFVPDSSDLTALGASLARKLILGPSCKTATGI
jgi:HEXXH motif-containing protein